MLGAQKGTILKMVLRRGLGLAAAGSGLGVAGALLVSHLTAGLLYGVSPDDLPTFSGVTLVLTTVALAASYIPALRAMRLDDLIFGPLSGPITVGRSRLRIGRRLKSCRGMLRGWSIRRRRRSISGSCVDGA